MPGQARVLARVDDHPAGRVPELDREPEMPPHAFIWG